jgi:hypothetical protein
MDEMVVGDVRGDCELMVLCVECCGETQNVFDVVNCDCELCE